MSILTMEVFYCGFNGFKQVDHLSLLTLEIMLYVDCCQRLNWYFAHRLFGQQRSLLQPVDYDLCRHKLQVPFIIVEVINCQSRLLSL